MTTIHVHTDPGTWHVTRGSSLPGLARELPTHNEWRSSVTQTRVWCWCHVTRDTCSRVCDVWHLQAGQVRLLRPRLRLVGAVRSQSAAALPAAHTNHPLHCWGINLATNFRAIFTIFAGSAHQRLTLWTRFPISGRLNHVSTPVLLESCVLIDSQVWKHEQALSTRRRCWCENSRNFADTSSSSIIWFHWTGQVIPSFLWLFFYDCQT